MESPSCSCGTAAFTTRTSAKNDLKYVFKLLIGQLGHVGAGKLLGGVAHHDVELAQLRHGLRHNMLAVERVAQVAGQQAAAPLAAG